MPTFVVLGKFTREGIAKIKESPKRLEASRQVTKSVGGKIMFYLKRFTWHQLEFVALLFLALEKANSEVQELRRKLNEKTRYIA